MPNWRELRAPATPSTKDLRAAYAAAVLREHVVDEQLKASYSGKVGCTCSSYVVVAAAASAHFRFSVGAVSASRVDRRELPWAASMKALPAWLPSSLASRVPRPAPTTRLQYRNLAHVERAATTEDDAIDRPADRPLEFSHVAKEPGHDHPLQHTLSARGEVPVIAQARAPSGQVEVKVKVLRLRKLIVRGRHPTIVRQERGVKLFFD